MWNDVASVAVFHLLHTAVTASNSPDMTFYRYAQYELKKKKCCQVFEAVMVRNVKPGSSFMVKRDKKKKATQPTIILYSKCISHTLLCLSCVCVCVPV